MKRLFFILFLIVGSMGLSSCNCDETMMPVVDPDLVVNAISVSEATPIPGQSIILSAIISNRGLANSPATTLSWYRSVDATITSSDTEVGTDTVSILSAGGDGEESITISAPLSTGIFYYGVCVDAVSGETSTTNNCSSATMITIAPDLVVSAISVSETAPIPAQSITLSTTISNRVLASSPAAILRWYRSVDATISTNGDVLEGTNAVAIISAGGDTNESITISAHSSIGTNYYGACVEDVSGETSTANNCSIGTMVVIPNQDFNTPPSAGNINTLSNAGNNSPFGLWSDGTTMWVSDVDDDKLYAYSLLTKTQIPSQDFNTLSNAENNIPRGLWSDGTTMWVSDSGRFKLFAYNLSTKARFTNEDFNTLVDAGNTLSIGLWSDGTNMWVADPADDKIYAYNMSTKARDASQDFNTLSNAGNNNPQGLWSDGTTMWVSDAVDDKIYAYSLSTKTRIASQDFDTLTNAGNNAPTGIWSDGTTMWVTDFDDSKLYAYNLATKQRQ